MNNRKNNLEVLILDQGRQTLPFLKSFARSGYNIVLVCNSRLNESCFSRYPSKRLFWPGYLENRSAFEKKLLDYLKDGKTDVVISLSDTTSDILSKYKKEISKYSSVTLPDYKIFLTGANKLNLMNYCMEKGFPCPRTYPLNDKNLHEVKNKLEYPVIVKPIGGVGAIGVTKISSREELVNNYNVLNEKYGNLLIQEYIPVEERKQFMAEAVVDDDGKMKVCVVIEKSRIFPVQAGTSSANVTVKYPEIVNTTKILLESLNWRGAADIDFIVDPRDNVAKILEINPRVTAGIKIAFMAGVDFADLHVKLAKGEGIPKIDEYKQGVYCRNFFLEMLWFFSSDLKMKKGTKPSFFKLPGKNMYDQVFSFDDPLTWLGFFLHMVKKYLSINKLRSKFHI